MHLAKNESTGLSAEIGFEGWSFEQKLEFIENSDEMSEKDWKGIDWMKFHNIQESKISHEHVSRKFNTGLLMMKN